MTDQKLEQTGHAEAQRSYHIRQKERGLSRLSVYVPDEAREEFWAAMSLLRQGWARRGLIDS